MESLKVYFNAKQITNIFDYFFMYLNLFVCLLFLLYSLLSSLLHLALNFENCTEQDTCNDLHVSLIRLPLTLTISLTLLFTQVTLCAGDGTCLAHHTAGSCGFLHAKKGTNVAAQAAAIALAKDAIRQDVKCVILVYT